MWPKDILVAFSHQWQSNDTGLASDQAVLTVGQTCSVLKGSSTVTFLMAELSAIESLGWQPNQPVRGQAKACIV